MNVTLQKHGTKHMYKVPEGLRELCTDISREVLRVQPEKMYSFISDYVDALLITRENAKVAVKMVNNILLGSESIVDILRQSGLTLEQITMAAIRIQKAFRAYLDKIGMRPATGVCEDKNFDEESRVSIRSILEATGASREQADRAATIIQVAFRGHYERLLLREAQGEIQWQREVINTVEILRKAGVSQEEASKAVTLIQSAYRGYYTRKNAKTKIPENYEDEAEDEGLLDPRETIQAIAWLDMMYEDSGFTKKRANEAATTIQSAFRKYRDKTGRTEVEQFESTESMVVRAILDDLRKRVFDNVLARDDIPKKFGTREEITQVADQLQNTYKEHLRQSQVSLKSDRDTYSTQHVNDAEEEKEEEEEEEEEAKENEDYQKNEVAPEEYLPVESVAEETVENEEEQRSEEHHSGTVSFTDTLPECLYYRLSIFIG